MNSSNKSKHNFISQLFPQRAKLQPLASTFVSSLLQFFRLETSLEIDYSILKQAPLLKTFAMMNLFHLYKKHEKHCPNN